MWVLLLSPSQQHHRGHLNPHLTKRKSRVREGHCPAEATWLGWTEPGSIFRGWRVVRREVTLKWHAGQKKNNYFAKEAVGSLAIKHTQKRIA